MMRRALAAAAALVVAGLVHVALEEPASGGSRGVMPHPAAGALAPGRAQLNATCVECHPEAAEQWQGSLHQRSFVDDDFAHAFSREPRPFCQGCHAPEADPSRRPGEAEAAMGVACVTCHVPPGAELPEGGVLASTGSAPLRPAPHAVVRRAAFGGVRACGGCHEFEASRSSALMMQTTLAEHRASAHAERSCQSCHMPTDGQGRRGHGFAASRDPAMLRAALQAHASREGEAVTIGLALGEVGHAFPTGDLFRRLSVEVGGDDEPDVPVDRRILARHFGHGGKARREVADDRLGMPGAPASVTLHAPSYARAPLWWRVVYERADMSVGEREPELFDRVIVAQGRL